MNYFSTCHIVLGLGKQQELPNQKCKTVEDALSVRVYIYCIVNKKLACGLGYLLSEESSRTGHRPPTHSCTALHSSSMHTEINDP
jgi:hypothetical protein